MTRYLITRTDGITITFDADTPAKARFINSVTDEDAADLGYASADRWSGRRAAWVPALSWNEHGQTVTVPTTLSV